MDSSNRDVIAILVQQNAIDGSEGFDYTDHELEPLFKYIFQFASDDLFASANEGDAVLIAFFIHSSPHFHAMANWGKPFIAISKGLVEILNYAIPEKDGSPAALEGMEGISGEEWRTFLLKNCLAFAYFHEKAHIMHKVQTVDLFGNAPVKVVVQTVDEFDEDAAGVESLLSTVQAEFIRTKDPELLATALLTALSLFFVALEHSVEEDGNSLTPPAHLRYAGCMLQLFKCLADRGITFAQSDIERIIRDAEQSCKQVVAPHLKDTIDLFYQSLIDTTTLQKDFREFAGESSRFPLLDRSIFSTIK